MRLVLTDFYRKRYYILTGALIFIASIIVGYRWEAFHQFLHIQIEGISVIAEELANSNNPQLNTFVFIFFNNAIKAVLIMYLGFFLGILPVLFIWINGMVLGYLYLYTAGDLTIWQFLIALLPHGIIELPIVIIACSYGLRFGVLIWRQILKSLRSDEGRVPEGEIKLFLLNSWPVAVFIVITLFFAAAIETFITPWLMGI